MRWFALVAVCSLIPRCAGADAKLPEWKRQRVALSERYVEGEFRIFFALAGESALSPEQRADTDRNGVPDKIQDLARQLVVARRVYVEVFKLRHPFESPRYKGRVKWFDVHVFRMPAGNFGSAGDAIVNYMHPTDPKRGCEVLTIDVSKDAACTNLTPMHELFHQVQNGYTLFKNPWFTEGTARWAQYALEKGVGKTAPLPATTAEKETLFKLKYDASGFWNALAQASDPKGAFRVTGDLAQARYACAPQLVIQDLRLHGIDLMRALLEELDAMDDKASKEEGLDHLNWSETRQRAPENDEAIWAATLNACRRFSGKSPQLRDFVTRFSPREEPRP